MGNATSSVDRSTVRSIQQRSTTMPDLVHLSFEAKEDESSSHTESSPASPAFRRKKVHLSALPSQWNFRLRSIDANHDECPICATEFQKDCIVTLLPCGHYFCQPCMNKWMERRKRGCTCPMCRQDLNTYLQRRKESKHLAPASIPSSSVPKIAVSPAENYHCAAAKPRLLIDDDNCAILLATPKMFEQNVDFDDFHRRNIQYTPKVLDRNFDLIMAKMLQIG